MEPRTSKSGEQGVAHLRETGAAGVAAGLRAPVGQQLRKVERVNATIRQIGRTGDVRQGKIPGGAILARRAGRVRVVDARAPRPEHRAEVKRINAAILHGNHTA